MRGGEARCSAVPVSRAAARRRGACVPSGREEPWRLAPHCRPGRLDALTAPRRWSLCAGGWGGGGGGGWPVWVWGGGGGGGVVGGPGGFRDPAGRWAWAGTTVALCPWLPERSAARASPSAQLPVPPRALSCPCLPERSAARASPLSCPCLPERSSCHPRALSCPWSTPERSAARAHPERSAARATPSAQLPVPPRSLSCPCHPERSAARATPGRAVADPGERATAAHTAEPAAPWPAPGRPRRCGPCPGSTRSL